MAVLNEKNVYWSFLHSLISESVERFKFSDSLFC
jgi:hypothetical protein